MDLDSRKEGGFHLFLKCRLLPAQFLWLIMHQSWVCSWWKVALAMARILMLLWQCLLGSEGSAQRSRPVLALWLHSKRGSSHWEQLCTIVLGSIGSLGLFWVFRLVPGVESESWAGEEQVAKDVGWECQMWWHLTADSGCWGSYF